jgi:hypothetical protein
MNGKAKLTDESNGTTSVPSATTSTPKPGRAVIGVAWLIRPISSKTARP